MMIASHAQQAHGMLQILIMYYVQQLLAQQEKKTTFKEQ